MFCKLLLEDYSTVIKYDIWLSSTAITNQDILNLSCLFCHSKTIEYIDTFFVLLKRGSPIFPQKYNHFGAAWSWCVLLYVASSAVIISCLFNSFVHTIMYCYYFLSVFDTRKQLSPGRPFNFAPTHTINYWVLYRFYVLRYASFKRGLMEQ